MLCLFPVSVGRTALRWIHSPASSGSEEQGVSLSTDPNLYAVSLHSIPCHSARSPPDSCPRDRRGLLPTRRRGGRTRTGGSYGGMPFFERERESQRVREREREKERACVLCVRLTRHSLFRPSETSCMREIMSAKGPPISASASLSVHEVVMGVRHADLGIVHTTRECSQWLPDTIRVDQRRPTPGREGEVARSLSMVTTSPSSVIPFSASQSRKRSR